MHRSHAEYSAASASGPSSPKNRLRPGAALSNAASIPLRAAPSPATTMRQGRSARRRRTDARIEYDAALSPDLIIAATTIQGTEGSRSNSAASVLRFASRFRLASRYGPGSRNGGSSLIAPPSASRGSRQATSSRIGQSISDAARIDSPAAACPIAQRPAARFGAKEGSAITYGIPSAAATDGPIQSGAL